MSDLIGKIIKDVSRAGKDSSNFDLDVWIEAFEEGFPKHHKQSEELNKTGFPWGQSYDNRPHIREVNQEIQAMEEDGYRVIEFFPNRRNKSEVYMLFGTPIELMTQVSLLMNQRRMLSSHDIGTFLGYPVDEYLRAKPREEVSLLFILTTNKEPPFHKTGLDWFSLRQVSVPAVDRRKLTYNVLRNACGGNEGQTWGEWSCRGYLSLADDTRGIHQMVAMGTTKEKALTNLESLMALSKCTIKRVSYHQIDFNKGTIAKDKNKDKYKSFRVYPAWVTVLNSRLVGLDDDSTGGKKTLSGKLISKKLKFYLWMQKEPIGWGAALKDLTKNNSAGLG